MLSAGHPHRAMGRKKTYRLVIYSAGLWLCRHRKLTDSTRWSCYSNPTCPILAFNVSVPPEETRDCTRLHRWIIHVNPNSSTVLTLRINAPTKTPHTRTCTYPHKWWSLGVAYSSLTQTSRLWKADKIKSCTLHITTPSVAMSVCIFHSESTLQQFVFSANLSFHVWLSLYPHISPFYTHLHFLLWETCHVLFCFFFTVAPIAF